MKVYVHSRALKNGQSDYSQCHRCRYQWEKEREKRLRWVREKERGIEWERVEDVKRDDHHDHLIYQLTFTDRNDDNNDWITRSTTIAQTQITVELTLRPRAGSFEGCPW